MDAIPKTLLIAVLTCALAPVSVSADSPAIENFLGMRFVLVPAGNFLMGTTDVDEARMEIPEPGPDDVMDETPAHQVIITRPFYLGETEVTQSAWHRVMGNRPGPAEFWTRDDWEQLPVAAASWFMAERFVGELNRLDNRYRYRLPTEAEWEYAARAGSPELRPFPLETIEDHAWFINNSGDHPQPVATRAPNALGLYDMLGNVWEWVADWYAPDTYTENERTDPRGPATGRSKVRRGASYHCPAHLVRPGYRSASPPDTRYSVLGFRVVAEPR
jgi:formylglycine-generating enzyme required for sulfatase activity